MLHDTSFLCWGKAKVAHALKSQKCGARVAGVEVLGVGFEAEGLGFRLSGSGGLRLRVWGVAFGATRSASVFWAEALWFLSKVSTRIVGLRAKSFQRTRGAATTVACGTSFRTIGNIKARNEEQEHVSHSQYACKTSQRSFI